MKHHTLFHEHFISCRKVSLHLRPLPSTWCGRCPIQQQLHHFQAQNHLKDIGDRQAWGGAHDLKLRSCKGALITLHLYGCWQGAGRLGQDWAHELHVWRQRPRPLHGKVCADDVQNQPPHLLWRAHINIMFIAAPQMSISHAAVAPACVQWRLCLSGVYLVQHLLRRAQLKHGYACLKYKIYVVWKHYNLIIWKSSKLM